MLSKWPRGREGMKGEGRGKRKEGRERKGGQRRWGAAISSLADEYHLWREGFARYQPT